MVLGALSIASCQLKPNGEKYVAHLKPIDKNEFRLQPLQKRLHLFPELKFLYPNISKHEVFENTDMNVPGYVNAEQRISIS